MLREKVARDRIVATACQCAALPDRGRGGMGTHYVTRELLALGHDVRQVTGLFQALPADAQE